MLVHHGLPGAFIRGYPLPDALPSLGSHKALLGGTTHRRGHLRLPLLAEVREALLESGGEACFAVLVPAGLPYDTADIRNNAAGELRLTHPSWGIWSIHASAAAAFIALSTGAVHLRQWVFFRQRHPKQWLPMLLIFEFPLIAAGGVGLPLWMACQMVLMR